MKYRLALFDFDGTLADSFPWFAKVINQVAEEFGFRKLDAEQMEMLRGRDNREIVKYLGVPMWKVPVIARHMRGLIAQNLHELPLFPGIPGAVRELRERGLMLGIVSSNSDENIRRILGPESCELFSHYGCGVSLFGKAARIRKVIGRSGVPADQVIYVGDEIRDIQAARELGIASGAVTWGYHLPDALQAQAPTELFGSVAEMVEKLTR